MPTKTTPTPPAPDVPDLRSLIREATRSSSTVTVPLKQGLRERIAALTTELADIAEGEAPKRMASKSPLKAKAEEIEAARAEMKASQLTFHFSAYDDPERDEIRDAMGGRDEEDELNLRAIAMMCRRVTAANGEDYAEKLTWEDFRDLRANLGVRVFEQTIDAAANECSGVDWSVPFSFAASHILATAK